MSNTNGNKDLDNSVLYDALKAKVDSTKDNLLYIPDSSQYDKPIQQFSSLSKYILQENILNKEKDFEKLEKLFKNSEFYIWNKEKHKERFKETKGNCCFNHIVGLPVKGSTIKPLFRYEQDLYDLMVNKQIKHIWIKKATGLGITEFMLRLCVWLALVNDEWYGGQICIVTGPNEYLAIGLIERIKNLFYRKGIVQDFKSDKKSLFLNGVEIKSYPSNHMAGMRSLTNPKFIFLDEADFFANREQIQARHVSERYIAKSKPYIVMVSTPNKPGGLFEQIEMEDESKTLYHREFLHYEIGLRDGMFTVEDIESARKSPAFPREYELQYLGVEGNVFSNNVLENITFTEEYDPKSIMMCSASIPKSLGIDPGFGYSIDASRFGMTLTARYNGKIFVLLAEEYENADPTIMRDKVSLLLSQFHNTKVYIDASAPGFVKELKAKLRDINYRYYLNDLSKYNMDKFRDPYLQRMRVVPVNFHMMGKIMLENTKQLVEHGLVRVHRRHFNKLCTAMKTATAVELDLDKEEMSYDDLFDSFRLSLTNFNIKLGS